MSVSKAITEDLEQFNRLSDALQLQIDRLSSVRDVIVLGVGLQVVGIVAAIWLWISVREQSGILALLVWIGIGLAGHSGYRLTHIRKALRACEQGLLAWLSLHGVVARVKVVL